MYSAFECASLVWCLSANTKKLYTSLNDSMHIITGSMRPIDTTFLPILCGIPLLTSGELKEDGDRKPIALDGGDTAL